MILYSEKKICLNLCFNSPFLTMALQVIPATQDRQRYQTTLPKKMGLLYDHLFPLWSSGHCLTACGTVSCSMTIHLITAETVILIHS